MIKAVVFLLIGFVCLIKGADFFVDGSSDIATRLKVPPLIIGLTIVAMGTSLPELSVSTLASINGNNSLAVSNAVGSNIFNFLVVLGVSAILKSIDVEKDVLRRDFPVSIICALGVVLLGIVSGGLTRASGVIFIVMFCVYLADVTRSAIKAQKINAANDKESDSEICDLRPVPISIIFIIGGVAAIKLGGDWVVNSAVTIAEFFGVSETLIGLTIVSVGTSLPELVTSIVAASKGKIEMAVGNAVGSNIFNILLILGVASVISPIPIITENIIDTVFLAVMSILGFRFCITQSRLEKKEGAVMLASYIGYMIYVLNR